MPSLFYGRLRRGHNKKLCTHNVNTGTANPLGPAPLLSVYLSLCLLSD